MRPGAREFASAAWTAWFFERQRRKRIMLRRSLRERRPCTPCGAVAGSSGWCLPTTLLFVLRCFGMLSEGRDTSGQSALAHSVTGHAFAPDLDQVDVQTRALDYSQRCGGVTSVRRCLAEMRRRLPGLEKRLELT